MGWLDRIPVEAPGGLYIGGLYSLRRREAVQNANISHVVSVMRFEFFEEQIRPYTHLQIEVDDEVDEDLLKSFPVTNKFIKNALEAGNSVLVHCAMGKSRSATVVIAFLMSEYGMSPLEALHRVRESRGVCEPNEGFMDQLKMYHDMKTPEDVEGHPIYQRWLYQRELDMSRACGQAPDADKIRFEDEHASDATNADFELRCRKCRRPLATSRYCVSHMTGSKSDQASSQQDSTSDTSKCAHYFIDALSWMRPELEQGKVEGRLECPKCKTNVGKYAWQGMQCSCGNWVVPGISLAKGRVDEVKSHNAGNASSIGIRLPPQAKNGGPMGHLHQVTGADCGHDLSRSTWGRFVFG